MTESRRLIITLGIAAVVAVGLAYLVKDALVAPVAPVARVAEAPRQAARVPAGPLLVLARDGGKRDLAVPTGKGLILHFWATWCAPCRDEMPELAAFVRDTRGDPNVEFLSVSVDEDWKVVDAWLKQRGLTDLPVVLDAGGPTAHLYGTDKFPETWFVTPGGEIVQHLVGAVNWRAPQFRKVAAEFSRASVSTALAR